MLERSDKLPQQPAALLSKCRQSPAWCVLLKAEISALVVVVRQLQERLALTGT